MVLVVERWRSRADASQVGLRAKRQHTGRSGSSWLWSTEEDVVVRRLAPDIAAIFTALRGRRTKGAISKRIALFIGPRRVA